MTTQTIRLLKPHTHMGRDYPAGAQLTLNEDDANWLIGIGSAKPEEISAQPVAPESAASPPPA